MNVFDTIVGRFFPTVFGDESDAGFDLWRLPNDPDSPHVGALRDLFVATFRMPPEAFDAYVEPREGTHRRLIVAARKHVICGGILYQMADNHLRPPERRVDGGYVSYVATRKNVRAQGAGRALLSLAHADFIVNGHSVSRLIRLDPRRTAFFEAAGYQRTEGGGYGDMHRVLDLSGESRAAAQLALDGLWTLY
ncbi:MAG TPA: GNAT family N-acetyltransferase [Propionicimonas sp.]|jgi:ribosomal protein S18 acetylase RimI-like enzyme|uniref:GNAT family N-acetyltransferase n=1 Tax=Propionicimonas sp. TaxID=1955623 RepID=UPI002F42389C